MSEHFEFARTLMLDHYQQNFLDDLLSDDPDTADHAANEFGDILFHQGDIYPASLEVVPHLVAALEFASPPLKRAFLYLLGGIATALHAPSGDPDLIPQATRRVLQNWDQIVPFLNDLDEGVRLATLITLTDLARINLPGMRFHSPAPFAGALPDGVTAQDIEHRLVQAIAVSETAFDEVWRQNCHIARAYLSFEPPTGNTHPYWEMLDRH